MPRTRKKDDVITFKVDASLAEALRGVSNRSEFIRTAILVALDSVCPLCMGTGILTPDQHSHWERFSEGHSVTKCSDCQAVHLVCREHGESTCA
jgi:hypothetical protein